MASFPAGDGGRVEVNAPSRAALLAAVDERLADGRGFAVATLNLDHLVKLRGSAAFRRAYRAHTLVTADGRPVVWLARLSGRPVALAPGSELVRPLAALAARRGVPVALLGSTAGVLDRAAERLASEHPGLEVAARIAPGRDLDPAGAEAGACLAQVARSGARLCLLALGAPKQELLAERALAAVPGCGFVSVGAGLDFLAGAQRRAPLWIRRIALEWLWRLASDPRRLGRRYLACALILPALAADALRTRRAAHPGPARPRGDGTGPA